MERLADALLNQLNDLERVDARRRRVTAGPGPVLEGVELPHEEPDLLRLDCVVGAGEAFLDQDGLEQLLEMNPGRNALVRQDRDVP